MPVDDNGEITGVMEVSANITEVKQLQHQLIMVGMAVTGMALVGPEEPGGDGLLVDLDLFDIHREDQVGNDADDGDHRLLTVLAGP